MPEWVLGLGQGMCWGSTGTPVRVQTALDLLPLSSPHLDAVQGPSWLRPPQLHTVLSCYRLHPRVELGRGARAGAQLGLGRELGDPGQPARAPGGLNLLPLPYFRSKQAGAHASRVESRFLTALLLVPLVFKPAMVTHSLGVDPQGWDAPICGLNHSLPREELQAHVIPLLFCVPSQGHEPRRDRFSSLPS